MPHHIISEIGPKRADYEPTDLDKTRMEDSVLVDPDLGIYIVADGLSSRRTVRGYGKQASQLAVNEVYNFLRKLKSIGPLDIKNAVQTASGIVLHETEDCGGTTLDVVVARYDHAVYGHAGDSRIYHATNKKAGLKEKIVKQLTKDHKDENDKQNNFLGLSNINVNTGIIHLKYNDLLLLCTDGVNNFIDEKVLKNLLASNYDPTFLANEIRNATESEMKAWDRQTDNFSMIVYRHEENLRLKTKKAEEKVFAR